MTKRFRHLVVALATFVVSDWLVLTFLDAAPTRRRRSLIDRLPLPVMADDRLRSTCSRCRSCWPRRPGEEARDDAAWIVVVLVAFSRLYLAADYPSNVAYAALLSWVLSETLFRWFVPDESFP